jgi:hypothetical protein
MTHEREIRLFSRPRVAWALALVQVIVLAQSVVFWAWSDVWSGPMIAIPGVMAFAAVGALIASQRTRNRLGWLLLMVPVPVILNVLILEYADLSVLHHVSLPFVGFAQWVVNWLWTPFLGMGFPMVIVRFPDGRVPRRWRFVDWLAAAGTIAFAASLAITGAASGGTGALTSAGVPQSASNALLQAGVGLITIAMLCAVASLTERYRHGDKKLRDQLKWMLLAAIVVAMTLVYMAVVEIAFQVPFGTAMQPGTVALVCIPVAIGVAVLRHHLFDIDLIISRTLVYVILTATLGGLYIAVIELMQRLFVLYTGETSDMAVVITAFIVAAAFTPIQKWIDKVVEQRFGRDVAAHVDGISSSMLAVVRVIDPHRVAHWLVDELVVAFEAEGGALYLHAHDRSRPFHASGHITGKAAIEVAVHHESVELGRLLLGRRRGGMEYSHRDVEALRAAAASLGEAIVVASDLGHIVLAAAPVAAVGGRA